MSPKAFMAGSMEHAFQTRADQRRSLPGILDAFHRCIGRRHDDQKDPLRTQGVDGDGGAQGAVDTARHADHDAGKTVLLDVVAQPHDKGAVDRVVAARPLGDPGRLTGPGVFPLPLPTALSGTSSLQDGMRAARSASLVENEGIAVEHQFVLTADEIDVGQRQPGFANPPAGEIHPDIRFVEFEG